MGALAGLVGGVVAGLFGVVLTAASWFVINDGARQLFSTTGTALLFLTIPLMIFGGCCLDWIEMEGKEVRFGLDAFTSGTGNNGSAFAGISVNTYWYNTTIGFAMPLGRFFMIIPMLALAGNLARKKAVPPSLGTFPATTPFFTTRLVSAILIVGALTFFPALSLGPIVERLLMYAGQVF